MSRALGVSSYIAHLIVATSLLTMLLATLWLRYRVRWTSTAGQTFVGPPIRAY
jgi:hypothetical protein